MNCPFCEKEMQKGRISCTTQHMTTLVFLKDGEKMRFRDIFRRDTVTTVISPGLCEQDAFYCEYCGKIVTSFDVT